MNLTSIKDSIEKHGLPATMKDVAYRAANKITDTLSLNAMVLTMQTLDRSYLEEDPAYVWGFLQRDVLLRALGQGAEKDMDAAFIDRALGKGDRCFGALHGEVLASYGWYSTKGTEVNDELQLRFDPAYAYMYKGYTLPAYRGARLHGKGMARALAAYTEEGKKGLVSYVMTTNFSSLKSCYRMGYVDFGKILCVKVGDRYLIHHAKGCERYAFRVVDGRSQLGEGPQGQQSTLV